jgi:hypothetical protein
MTLPNTIFAARISGKDFFDSRLTLGSTPPVSTVRTALYLHISPIFGAFLSSKKQYHSLENSCIFHLEFRRVSRSRGPDGAGSDVRSREFGSTRTSVVVSGRGKLTSQFDANSTYTSACAYDSALRHSISSITPILGPSMDFGRLVRTTRRHSMVSVPRKPR